MRKPLPIVLPIVALTALVPLQAVPPELPRCVPDDVVAAWFVDANQAAGKIGTLNSLNVARFVVDQAGELGLLSRVDTASRAWIDALAALSVVLEHPHAVALFEVRAKPLQDGGHRLAELSGALVIQSRGENAAIERRIQRLLNTYTNRDQSALTTKTGPDGAITSLRDRRMDEWAVITWGPVGQFYVVAIGEGSFERIVASIRGQGMTLQQNEWFQAAFEQMTGADAAFALWTNFATLQAAADDTLAGKIARVRDTLGLYEVEKGLWTVRYEGRAVNAAGYVHAFGKDRLRPLTTGSLAGASHEQLIPAEATGYAIFDVAPRQVLTLVSEAYMAARGPRGRRSTLEYWRQLEAKAGISIEGDVFGNLGRGVIIHDYPRNALRLPFLWTFAAPVAGNPAELRGAIDRLFHAWDEELKDRGASLRLRSDADGVWCMFIGVNGPAVALGDRWLVVSFSPDAARQNLGALEDQTKPGADRLSHRPSDEKGGLDNQRNTSVP